MQVKTATGLLKFSVHLYANYVDGNYIISLIAIRIYGEFSV